jgi:putative endonuclease
VPHRRARRRQLRPETAVCTTGSSNKERKRAALDRGSAAERAVVAYLAERGYAIVATNLRVGRLELDIVATTGDTVVIVEVRTRGVTAWQTGLESLGATKVRRVRAAGERLWRERFSRDARVNRMRFDAAVVVFGREGDPVVEHVPAAF